MADRTVLRMGDPVLRLVAEPVTEFDTPELHELVADMWETMDVYGGIGLAAPQIGVSKRLVVFGLAEDEDEDEDHGGIDIPRTVLINPIIEPLDDEAALGWEGCLSIPGMRGVVPRSLRIRYRGFDLEGNAIEREVEDFHARVVQHECDHLDGVLYPMRIRDMSTFGFEEELNRAAEAAIAAGEVDEEEALRAEL